MYSFYRAWLMRDAVTATLATPPDILINVGGHHLPPIHSSTTKYHQFAAHRHIVSAHSGYLKALLTTTPGQSISVPNVTPEAFGPLLTYMYTGYLDVNIENIYSILLATHLLHMPRALDQCRAFLIQNQHPNLSTLHHGVSQRLESELAGSYHSQHGVSSQNDVVVDKHSTNQRDGLPTLVKPIPSRKMLPVLFNLNSSMTGSTGPVSSNFWPHLPYPLPPPPMMMSNNHSPFKTVLSTSIQDIHEPALQYTSPAEKLRESLPFAERAKSPIKSLPKKRPKSPLAIPSTSTNRRSVLLRVQSPVRSSSVSPCLSNSSLESDELNVHLSSEDNQEQMKMDKQKHSKTSGQKKTENHIENLCSASEKSKVIIDVACCDGPVRFHRVLNDNYGFAVDEIVVENNTQENVGITSMRKEFAIRRSANTNNLMIPKKIAKLSAVAVAETCSEVQDVSGDCNPNKESNIVKGSNDGNSLVELTTHANKQLNGEVTALDYLINRGSDPSNHNVNSEKIAIDEATHSRMPTPLSGTNDQQESVNNLGPIDNPPSYGQLSAFGNMGTTERFENTIGQSEAYLNNINNSGSSSNFSNQSGSSINNAHQLGEVSNYTNHATTSANTEFQSNQKEVSGQMTNPAASKPGSDNIYTCVYCNHTFKSHYCYQKHARRHINPVTLDMNNLVDRIASKTICNPTLKVADKSSGVRREVRLLDMNVQYYPCKTCGSKFPSYYFVHKHRKMCHADEADEITGSEESQTHSQSTTINSV